MIAHRERNTTGADRRLTAVRNAYVASINAALEDGRDGLAQELAAEFEAEYLDPSRLLPAASS